MTTMSEYLSTSSGTFELRVAIEGCPLEFCSLHSMGGVLSAFAGLEGVRRVGGLRRDGLSFMESAYLPGADYKASLGSVSIEDTDESVAWNTRAASSVFSAVPREAAYLSATVTSSDTTWTVLSTDGLTAGTVYHVDTEAVRVDTIVDSTTIEVTRGMWRTTAQAHFRAASTLAGDSTLICAMWTSPATYRRRRVWIYGHGPSETGTSSSGTLLARGIISSAPTLSDGSTWSFPLGSLTSLFDASVGPREGAGQIVGIYYPGATPYRFHINKYSGPDLFGSTWDSRITIYMVGFWRSNDDFCRELNSQIETKAAAEGWTEQIVAQPIGDGWELYVTTADTPNQAYFAATGGSAVDGIFAGYLKTGEPEGPRVTVVNHSQRYRFVWVQATEPGMGSCPEAGIRGVPRSSSFEQRGPAVLPTDAATYPWSRIYLSTSSGISPGDTMRVSADDDGVRTAYAWEAEVLDVDPTSGAVTWDIDTMRRVGEPIVPDRDLGIWTIVTPASLPSVTLVRNLGTGHVGDMLQALVASSPDLANAGTVPFLLTSDFDSFSTIDTAVREAAAGRAWLLSRRYTYASQVRFADIIKHELRLLGAYLATTATGAITIRPLLPRLDEDHTLASTDLATSDGFGDLVVEPDGVLTGLDIKTGYDSAEDEHKGPTVNVVALGALAAQRQYLALEVAPKSTPTGTEPSPEELAGHCYGKVSLWSRIRFGASVPVLVSFYDALIGDAVYCTIPQLPYDGERGIDGGGGGIVAVRGTIIGRSWRFSETVVTLTILFDSLTISGYAPTGRVTSQTGATTTWDVTLDADEYGPGGSVHDASFFVTGYKVRLYEYDVDAPTIVTGTVTGVSGDVVSIETDATWTPGTSTWNLCFAQSTTSGIATAQLRYAYLARSDFRVHLASGTESPDRFSP